MKKTVSAVLVLLSVWVFQSMVFAGDPPAGKKVIEIPAGERGVVTLPHETHQKALKDCMKCHSLFPQKANAITEMMASGKLQKKQVMGMCLACHRSMKSAGTKTGPTACNQCHKN
jgi:tRNA(Ile2) C34 agmatinyltransferase TiaS